MRGLKPAISTMHFQQVCYCAAEIYHKMRLLLADEHLCTSRIQHAGCRRLQSVIKACYNFLYARSSVV